MPLDPKQLIEAGNYKSISVPHEWPWPNFFPKELACGHCGALRISFGLMGRLQALREILDRPVIISSGYRCPEHNQKVSTTGPNGPHVQGLAVDIIANQRETYQILRYVHLFGFRGVGIGKGFIHLDIIQAEPRPNVWTYP